MFNSHLLTPPRQRAILFTCGAILALVLVGAYPAYRYAKDWRSEYLVERSTEYADQERPIEAFKSALSAHYLNPESESVLLNLARKASAVRHPANIDWWIRVLDHPERNAEDLFVFFNLLVMKGEMDLAERYYAKYESQLPETLDSWQLEVGILAFKHRNYDALSKINELLEAGHDDWFLFRKKIELTLALNRPGAIAEAKAVLHELSDRDDVVGVNASRWLLRLGELSEERQIQLIPRLRAGNDVSETNRLLAYSLEFRHGLASFERKKSEIYSMFDLDDNSELRQLIQWLFAEGEIDACLSLLDPEIARKDEVLFATLLKLKIQNGETEEAFELTLEQNEKNPLGTVENLIIRAQALLASGNKDMFRKNLGIAVEVVDLAQFQLVESELLVHQEFELLTQLYRRLAANDPTRVIGLSKLMLAYFSKGDDYALFDLVEDVELSSFAFDPAFQSFVAYIKLLEGNELAEARQVFERLVVKHPGVVDFKIYLAFAYHRMGQTEYARALIKDIKTIPFLEHRRTLLVPLVSVLGGVEDALFLNVSSDVFEKMSLLRRERLLMQNRDTVARR